MTYGTGKDDGHLKPGGAKIPGKPNNMAHAFSFLWHMIILYSVTFLVVLPIVCYHLEYSIYYQFLADRDENSLNRAKQTRIEQTSVMNEQRVHESLHFLTSLKLKIKTATEKFPKIFEEQKEYTKKPLFVAVTVITASRKRAHDSYDPRYLTQVSSQLLKLIELESRQARSKVKTKNHNGFADVQYKLFLCNVDFKPLHHEEVNSLMAFIPSFSRFKGNESFIPPSFSELFEKEKEDYVFCLRESLLEVADGKLPDYVLLLEDDAFPNTNLFSVLTHVLYSHLENRHVHFLTKKKKNVGYVKLYHPRRLQGFISLEPERLPELLGLSLVFGTLLTLLYSYVKPRAYSSAANGGVDFCLLVLVIYCGMVALCIGRQNIMRFRQLSKHLYTFVPAPHCCTPAMLFPRHNAWHIINELSQVRCMAGYGKDTALYDIMKQSNMSAFMVSPSLFEHIGMYSMLRRGKLVDPAILP